MFLQVLPTWKRFYIWETPIKIRRKNRLRNWHENLWNEIFMADCLLTSNLQEIIISILTKNNAKRIAIFGSYARGEEGPDSDLDILVRFSPPKSLLQLIRIENELKRSLKIKIDLITENSVNRYIADDIKTDEIVIYENEGSHISLPHSWLYFWHRKFSQEIHSSSDLLEKKLERAGIERMLTVIGEAAKNLSSELRQETSDIPWRDTRGDER